MLIGTGGMSHQLDGKRAGFINKDFDMMCMEKLIDDPEALTKYSIDDIIKLAGTQGAEIINWLIPPCCPDRHGIQGSQQPPYPYFEHRRRRTGTRERRVVLPPRVDYALFL